MNTKTILKVTAMVVLMLMVMCIAVNSFALTPSEITADANTNTTGISKVGKQVVGVLQAVGIVLSVVVLIVIGLKYMIGSAEEKAEYKKTLMPYVAGALLIFAASALANVIYNFFSNISVS